MIKAIEYTPVKRIQGRVIYNLGFGDYDEKTGEVFDDVNSNNGDMWRVFSTVLNTVPEFFRDQPNDAIWVQGSDGHDEFFKHCKISCKKKCRNFCKNVDRRIKTYRYYVEKNFNDLCKEYLIFGSYSINPVQVSQYIVGNEYVGILVFKKK